MGILSIRKLADKTSGRRVTRYDPDTGQPKLVNPDTPGEEHEAWPLAGVLIEGEVPRETTAGIAFINKGIAEGWIERRGERPIVRPAGKSQADWNGVQGQPHVFLHADEIVFKTLDGDVVYRVVHQPDKYAITAYMPLSVEKGLYEEIIDDNEPVTPEIYAAGDTRVDNWYGLELVEG